MISYLDREDTGRFALTVLDPYDPGVQFHMLNTMWNLFDT